MKLETDDIHRRVKRLIVERMFLEGLDPADIADDAPLRQELGLDSIDALELVLGIEQEFGIQLVSSGIGREAFTSVRTLGELVAARVGEGAQDDGQE